MIQANDNDNFDEDIDPELNDFLNDDPWTGY